MLPIYDFNKNKRIENIFDLTWFDSSPAQSYWQQQIYEMYLFRKPIFIRIFIYLASAIIHYRIQLNNIFRNDYRIFKKIPEWDRFRTVEDHLRLKRKKSIISGQSRKWKKKTLSKPVITFVICLLEAESLPIYLRLDG